MSVIYKISCKDLNIKECYFGSTINFQKRKHKHKSACDNENSKKYNFPVYIFIRANGGWSNWTMNVIEELDTTDKEIYEKCEAKYIEENKDIVLNKQIPGRSDNEYYQDHKEKINEYKKDWYQDNKEKLKQKVPCDICNKIITKSNLARHQNLMKCFKLI